MSTIRRMGACGACGAVLAGVAFAAVAPREALAQCDARWSSAFGLDGFDGPLQAAVEFDTDGDGPQRARLLVGGSFNSVRGRPASGVAALGETGWQSVGDTGAFASAWRFARFDADGTGPLPERLVVAATAAGLSGFGIFEFRGTSGGWVQIAPGLSFDSVQAMTSFDPDGEGPLPPMLLVAGSRTDGATSQSGVHRVTPAGATFVGDSPTDSQTRAIVQFDEDGPGPLPPRLWVAGFFPRGNRFVMLRTWDGAAWTDELTDADGPGGLFALAVIDLDADGPDPAALYLGGSFNRLGGVTVRNLARRDGGTWTTVGDDLPISASHVVAADLDGSGPLPRTLCVAVVGAPPLTTASNVYWMDPIRGTWRPAAPVDGFVSGLLGTDPDGSGPREERLVAVGEFGSVGGVPMASIAAFDGRQWTPLESFGDLGAYRNPSAFLVHDDDADGPLGPVLYAGGSFLSIGGVPARGLAKYDGSTWVREAGISATSVPAMVGFDPDGDGPMPLGLAVGGQGITPAGQAATGVALRGPGGWARLAAGPGTSNSNIHALAVYDEDGAGPNPPRLFAGGDFFVIRNNVTFRGIGRWNGTAWEPVGSGVLGTVNALVVFDDDGPGPRGPALYAGGAFSTAGGVNTGSVARWDGTAWTATVTDAANRPNSTVSELLVFDPDGPGPRLPALFASGSFTFDLAGRRNRDIARLENGAWRSVGVLPFPPSGSTALTGNAGAMLALDLDAAGPNPPVLVLAGAFSFFPPPAGLSSGQRLAQWDAALDRWVPLPFNTIQGTAGAMAVAPFPAGSSSLFVSGRFSTAGAGPAGGGVSSRNIARYGPGLDAGIVEQPLDRDAPVDATVVLRGRAFSGTPLAHQWSLNGEPLIDGPHPAGMIVSGAGTDTLTLSGVQRAGGGEYRLRFITPCGELVSRAATVRVLCPADFDSSGEVDPDDLSDVIACYFRAEPCAAVDFDGSGEVNADDLMDYIGWFYSPCP